MVRHQALVLHPDDNVAVALEDLAAGQAVETGPAGVLVLAQMVPFGHKFALRSIRRGSSVVKYGHPIGQALVDIAAGSWVHMHNLASAKAGPPARSPPPEARRP